MCKGLFILWRNESIRFLNEINQKYLDIHMDMEDKNTTNEDGIISDISDVGHIQKSVQTNISTINNIFGPYKHGDIVKHYKYGICEFDKYIDSRDVQSFNAQDL